MKKFLSKISIFIVVAILFLPSPSVFAKEDGRICSPDGYTIVTINGIFTDTNGAVENRDILERKLTDEYNNETLRVDYLFNPSHLGGLGDLIKFVEQKLFDSWAVVDYDLVEMIKDSSDKVKTQKLLVVGYSQGNFYANSFYDKVAGKFGGVPKESIGAYSVATPAGRVAGNGKYITSDTDKVIAGWVSSFTLGNIMKPNTHIDFVEDANGHSFSDTYMKYRGSEIVSDIQSSLDKLSANGIQDEQEQCIAKPDLGLIGNARQYTKGAALFVLDPIASVTKKVVFDAVSNVAATVGNIFAKRKTPAPNDFVAQISNVFSSNETVPTDVGQSTSIPSVPVMIASQKAAAPAPKLPPIANVISSAPQSQLAPTVSSAVSTASVSGRRRPSSSSASVAPLPVSLAPLPAPIPPPVPPVEPPVVPPAPVPEPVPPPPVPPVEPPPVSPAPTPVPPPPAPIPPAFPEVADFSVTYDRDKLELVFSWTPFASVTHKILDANGASIFETTSASTYRKRIYEIGRDYDFSIKALDALGMELASAVKSISVPSFVHDTHFFKADYKHTSATSAEMPLIEFSYDEYPFAPQDLVYAPHGLPSTGPNWKTAVFYLNTDAPSDPVANQFLLNWSPLDSSSVLKTSYGTCVGSSPYFQYSLLLPDVAGNCGVGSALINSAMNWAVHLADPDGHLVLPVEGPGGQTLFSSDDYFTVAYYGFYRDYPQGTSLENGGAQTFKLLAVDKTHYAFEDSVPTHENPNPPIGIQFVLDETKSVLTTSWSAAMDADSPDAYLRYEISYDLGETWKQVGLTDSVVVAAGDIYTPQVRAIDDFGLRSEPLSDSFAVPEMPHPKFGVSNLRWGNIDGARSLKFDYPSFPFITDNSGNSYNAMIFYFNSLPPITYPYIAHGSSEYPQVQVAYASCDGSFRDYQKLILTRSELQGCEAAGTGLHRQALFPSPAPTGGSATIQIRALSNVAKPITELSSDGYFTVGFYSIDPWGNVISIANDTHRYFFEP